MSDTPPPPARGGVWAQGYATAPATMVVLAVTVGAWLLQAFLKATVHVNLDDTLAGNGRLGTDGDWWRLVTPVVVHFGVLHLAFNMAWLYQLGPAVERILGRVGFVATYVATGIAGNVCSDAVYWHRNVVSGGASGAIYGLGCVIVGAWLVTRRLDARRGDAPPPSRALRFNEDVVRSLAVLFGAYLVITFVFLRGVDTAAHFGGGVLGLMVGAGVAWARNGPHAAAREPSGG